ncbi:hypothetical protein ACFLXZ_00995 [Chloroflexota bacterium]
MLLKSLQFALLTFGITLVTAFLVAGIVKLIAVVVGRGGRSGKGSDAN